MEILKVCLLISCLTLSIRHSVSQFGPFPGGFDGGYINYNSRNSLPPPQQQFERQSSGNCDQFWSYDSDYNGQFGVIRITRPDYRTSTIRVVLSIAAQLAPKNSGSLDLSKNLEATISDISQGLPLFYRVNFPIPHPVPHIMEIYYNDQLLCTAPKVTGSYVTTITLDYYFYTGLRHPPPVLHQEQPWPIQPTQPEQRPVIQEIVPEVTTRKPQATTRKSTTSSPPVEPPSTYDVAFECGVPEYKPPTTTGLIFRGKEVGRGQFPWLAALYYSPQNDDSGFICGGSLISKKLVVTAAHCIQRKEDSEANRIKADEILFHFGKSNLQSLESEPGHIFSAVTDVHIHPDWNYKTQDYDADIAITVLSRTIIFNKFVKPICIWTTTQSFDDIVGVEGVVAGWGVDENKLLSTARPKWARIPVVTSEVCLRSHSSFRTLTSRRTFCAGETLPSRVGESGPCNGDSGGGFIVKNGDKWYLRGIISAAIVDPETHTCNPENYSVFTDTAKFTSWIQNYMTQYG